MNFWTKKTKQARRSEESLSSTKSAKEINLSEKSSVKSVSLPPSPNVIPVLPFVASSAYQECTTNDNDGLMVKVNSEDEKRLLTTIRDELRNSPILKILLQAKLNKECEKA